MTQIDFARDMLASGKSRAAVVRALEARGMNRPNALATVSRAANKPKPATLRGGGVANGGGLLVAAGPELREELHREARARGMTTAYMCGEMLRLIVEDRIVGAVLGED